METDAKQFVFVQKSPVRRFPKGKCNQGQGWFHKNESRGTLPGSQSKNKQRPGDMPKHILVGCTGSVASLKLPVLLNALAESDLKPEVRVIATEHSQHFFNREEISVPLYTDRDEWETWRTRADPVLHIELRKWADILLIAPLDANTLAKMASGICDNLLTCVVRAWDQKKPLLFAPAMNTFMWDHPITSDHIDSLKKYGYTEVPCISKKLVCGDTGLGAMAEVPTLVTAVEEALENIPLERTV